MNKFCKCEQTAGYEPCTRPPKITLRTVALPANLGDDTEGAPYAPRLGAYYNTVVQYLSNKATYIYDSNGIYTLVEPGNYDQLVAKVDGLAEALTALQEKEQEDIDNLQENINQLANKEAEDVENLQININAEVNARTAADNEIHQRITDIQNSPDVRFIEPTYAALEELDKAGISDKDYARVLQDENHDGASTYYQFDLASQTWNYVGEVGDYYTKGQIDTQLATINNAIAAVDTTKLNELADIKTIGDNLSLSEEGVLSSTGGGTAEPWVPFRLSLNFVNTDSSRNGIWFEAQLPFEAPYNRQFEMDIQRGGVDIANQDGSTPTLSSILPLYFILNETEFYGTTTSPTAEIGSTNSLRAGDISSMLILGKNVTQESPGTLRAFLPYPDYGQIDVAVTSISITGYYRFTILE